MLAALNEQIAELEDKLEDQTFLEQPAQLVKQEQAAAMAGALPLFPSVPSKLECLPDCLLEEVALFATLRDVAAITASSKALARRREVAWRCAALAQFPAIAHLRAQMTLPLSYRDLAEQQHHIRQDKAPPMPGADVEQVRCALLYFAAHLTCVSLSPHTPRPLPSSAPAHSHAAAPRRQHHARCQVEAKRSICPAEKSSR